MTPAEKSWLVNRIQAAIADDFYLDRDEEKGLKEEASAKGIAISDIELTLRAEMDSFGAVSERNLTDELDRLLHQFTDSDKVLDGKEERTALDKVLRPAPGKKAALDPRVAEDFVHSFCRVNAVRRNADSKKWLAPLGIFGLIVLIALASLYWFKSKASNSEFAGAASTQGHQENHDAVLLNTTDKAEIDDNLRRARQYVDEAQYTDPPEKSAKASIDSIRQIDPNGQYRGDDVKAIASVIVSHYLELAAKSNSTGDVESARKWLDRAKLMNADVELIREKERSLGLLPSEK